MTSDAADDTTPVSIPTKSTMGVMYKELHLSGKCLSWEGLKVDMPDDDKVNSYAKYFDQTWMNG